MERISLGTPDLTQENIEKLGELFPQVMTEVEGDNGEIKHAVDFDALRDLLGDVAEGARERYQFTWPGKREAKAEARRPISKTMRPCPEESVNWDTTENLYIEGDNLDALKILKETYAGKVKMIYIDPPYNTGHDFVYDDDFAKTRGEYDAESGEYSEEGGRLVANPESNGRFHSDWCSMMYPRLMLARELLSADGVIFISIDDNEVNNLDRLMGEIFGEENHINTLAVNMSNMSGPKVQHAITGKRFPKIKEYVLVYCKDRTTYKLRIPKEKKTSWDSEYNLIVPELTKREYSLMYESDIDVESASQLFAEKTLVSLNSYMKANAIEDSVEWKLENSYRIFASKPNTALLKKASCMEFAQPMAVIANASGQTKLIKTDFNRETRTARIELANAQINSESFFGDHWGDIVTTGGVAQEGGVPFENGKKPLKLLRRIMESVLTEEPSVVVDFFGGSSSTAHALIEGNASKGSSHRFIIVQIPEVVPVDSEAGKQGFETICEIGKERIRRAGKKVAAEVEEANKQLKLGEEPKKVPDIGFRVMKIESSNFNDVSFIPGETSQQMLLDFSDNLKDGRSDLDILFEVLPKFRIPYSAKIEEIDVCGKRCFNVEDGELVACFDKNVGIETIEEIAKMQPLYAVLRDASMADDATHANFEELFKVYSPDTVRRVI